MSQFEMCNKCAKRKCYKTPKLGKMGFAVCREYVKPKEGWALKEVYHDKPTQA